ncbi:hypothetical protein P6U16_00875 [Rhizobium sp. 32-5/1]|uniref:hypothetical protein n=1 Tax=Rhizobium sp. 32-5/1 TaxID=3019602 RepID=UPI00240E889C|nr:hypothetical protein [Rhizobium sp. 32-5/1]WEZ83464.1 hypothetical protein P6U16_00875 [Rhizobium sp. 32-5/1]
MPETGFNLAKTAVGEQKHDERRKRRVFTGATNSARLQRQVVRALPLEDWQLCGELGGACAVAAENSWEEIHAPGKME